MTDHARSISYGRARTALDGVRWRNTCAPTAPVTRNLRPSRELTSSTSRRGCHPGATTYASIVALAAALVTAGAAVARPADVGAVHVAAAGLRGRLARAAAKVAAPSCGPAVLAHFRVPVPDQAGIENKLAALTFEDGAEHPVCKTGRAAVANVHGNTVWICPGWQQLDLATGDAILIHEILHTLGLGENPPSSREITAEVLRRCR